MTQPVKMTVEEFIKTYKKDDLVELLNGRVIDTPPHEFGAAIVSPKVTFHLLDWVKPHDLGQVTPANGGYILSPYTLLGPSGGYFTKAKYNQIVDWHKHLPFAPDIAVEVLSRFDNPLDVMEKIQAYLQAGSALVWVIYWNLQIAYVYYPDGSAKRVERHESLSGEAILPGFELPLVQLFAED